MRNHHKAEIQKLKEEIAKQQGDVKWNLKDSREIEEKDKTIS